MTIDAFDREKAVAMDAALGAARRIAEIYDLNFSVDYKDAAHDDPVTQADRDANAIIVDRLRREFPDDAVVAEESDVPAGFEKKSRCWFVDPLDGTKEFVAKNGEFCVMIGLAVDGRAKLGVLCMPTTFERYVGVVGVGATRVERRGEESPLRVSARTDAKHARVVVSRSRRSPMLGAIFSALGAPEEIPCGSVGVKIAQVAVGAADAYVHPSSLRPSGGNADGVVTTGGPKKWDTCAPEAILVAAGGTFTDQDGARIAYASRDLGVHDGVVASNGAMHPALLDAILRAKHR
jgi:3'(2'), 5'-bisphosphate nucleotidase